MNSSIFLVVRKYLAKILTGDLTLRRGDQMLNLIIAPMLPRGKLRIYTWTHFRICWKNVSPSNWKWISSILRPPPSRKCSYRNWTGATFDCWMGSHEEWTMSKSHVTSQFSTRLRADLAPCSEMVRSFFQSPIPGLKPTWHGPTVYRMCLG